MLVFRVLFVWFESFWSGVIERQSKNMHSDHLSTSLQFMAVFQSGKMQETSPVGDCSWGLGVASSFVL